MSMDWVEDDHWPATGMSFRLTIDGHDLGAFTGVKGLIVESETLEWPELGQNGFVNRLPGRVKYRDVTLTRNTNHHSAAVITWIDQCRRQHKVCTAAVEAYDSKNALVATWSLVGVWPLRYTGPVLDATVAAMAKETLDLAHSGFTMKAGA